MQNVIAKNFIVKLIAAHHIMKKMRIVKHQHISKRMHDDLMTDEELESSETSKISKENIIAMHEVKGI